MALTGGASPQSTTMTAGAAVIAKCTISGTTLAFGSYDPVVTNRSTPLDVAPNALSVSCTRGAPGVTIQLNSGLHASGNTRYMSDGASHLLQYDIYTSSARTTVWDSTNTVSYLSSSMAATALPVYGRVPAGQDAYVGATYTDTITATVNF